MRKNQVRDLEELCTLQAQAIAALQQAAKALEIALKAMERSLNEKGTQEKMFQQPYLLPQMPNYPIQAPYITQPNTWGDTVPMTTSGQTQLPGNVYLGGSVMGQAGGSNGLGQAISGKGDFQQYNSSEYSPEDINVLKALKNMNHSIATDAMNTVKAQKAQMVFQGFVDGLGNKYV